MKTQHTPGPWTFESEPNGISFSIWYDDYTTVAEAGNQYDARLIAAAPELLEALERAERQLAIAYNPSDSPILELDRSEAQLSCNQARAAIAKAKGTP